MPPASGSGTSLVATIALAMAASIVGIRYGQRAGIQLRLDNATSWRAADRSASERRRGPRRFSFPCTPPPRAPALNPPLLRPSRLRATSGVLSKPFRKMTTPWRATFDNRLSRARVRQVMLCSELPARRGALRSSHHRAATARKCMRHIAIIGSGPAGYYTAEAAQKLFGDRVRVDVFDALPVPYGLIRTGVAPDHQSIKAVSGRYEKVALSENVRFVGNVMVGRDISVPELR